MPNIILALMVMVMSVQCFTITYKLNGINRTLIEIPLSIFEISIPLYEEVDNFIPVFDQQSLVDRLTYYFDEKIPAYSLQYHVEYFFSKTDESSLCIDNKCNAIEINLQAQVTYLIKYQKTVRYQIIEGY